MQFKQHVILTAVIALPYILEAADPGTLIKDKAKGLRNLNQTAPDEGSPAGGPPRSVPAQNKSANQPQTKSTASSANVSSQLAYLNQRLNTDQKTTADKLLKELNKIDDVDTAADHTQQLMSELLSACQGRTAPSINTLTAFSGDLAAAWPTQKLQAQGKELFVKYLVYLLTSSSLQPQDSASTYKNMDTLLKTSGMHPTEAQKIMSGFKKILSKG